MCCLISAYALCLNLISLFILSIALRFQQKWEMNWEGGRKDWIESGERRWITTNFRRHSVVNYAKSLTSIFSFHSLNSSIEKTFFIKIKKRNFHRKRHFRLCHFVNFTYIPLHFIQGLDIYKNWKQIPFQTETTSEREPNSCTPKKNSLFFAIAIEIHHAEHAFVGNERENIISKRYCAMLNRIYTRIDYSEFHIENWFCIFLCVLFSSSFAAAYLPSSKRETTQICAMLREYFTKKSLFFLFYHPWKIKLVYPANCIL
jgi:hypothetical protein